MALFKQLVESSDQLLTEAFNSKPYETTMTKKGAGDVFFTFEDEDGKEFRVQFYTSGGLGKSVRRVYVGEKQGNVYKDAIKGFKNPMRVIATMIKSTEDYLQTPLGKSIQGLAVDLSAKAAPKGRRLIQKIMKRSVVIKKHLDVLDSDLTVDPGRGVVWTVRKGVDPAAVYDGKKVAGLLSSGGVAVAPKEPSMKDKQREIAAILLKKPFEEMTGVISGSYRDAMRLVVEVNGNVVISKGGTDVSTYEFRKNESPKQFTARISGALEAMADRFDAGEWDAGYRRWKDSPSAVKDVNDSTAQIMFNSLERILRSRLGFYGQFTFEDEGNRILKGRFHGNGYEFRVSVNTEKLQYVFEGSLYSNVDPIIEHIEKMIEPVVEPKTTAPKEFGNWTVYANGEVTHADGKIKNLVSMVYDKTKQQYGATIDNTHVYGMTDIQNALARKGIRIPDEVLTTMTTSDDDNTSVSVSVGRDVKGSYTGVYVSVTDNGMWTDVKFQNKNGDKLATITMNSGEVPTGEYVGSVSIGRGVAGSNNTGVGTFEKSALLGNKIEVRDDIGSRLIGASFNVSVEPELAVGQNIIDAFELDDNGEGGYEADIGDDDWLEVNGSEWSLSYASNDTPYASGSVNDSGVIDAIKRAVKGRTKDSFDSLDDTPPSNIQLLAAVETALKKVVGNLGESNAEVKVVPSEGGDTEWDVMSNKSGPNDPKYIMANVKALQNGGLMVEYDHGQGEDLMKMVDWDSPNASAERLFSDLYTAFARVLSSWVNNFVDPVAAAKVKARTAKDNTAMEMQKAIEEEIAHIVEANGYFTTLGNPQAPFVQVEDSDGEVIAMYDLDGGQIHLEYGDEDYGDEERIKVTLQDLRFELWADRVPPKPRDAEVVGAGSSDKPAKISAEDAKVKYKGGAGKAFTEYMKLINAYNFISKKPESSDRNVDLGRYKDQLAPLADDLIDALQAANPAIDAYIEDVRSYIRYDFQYSKFSGASVKRAIQNKVNEMLGVDGVEIEQPKTSIGSFSDMLGGETGGVDAKMFTIHTFNATSPGARGVDAKIHVDLEMGDVWATYAGGRGSNPALSNFSKLWLGRDKDTRAVKEAAIDGADNKNARELNRISNHTFTYAGTREAVNHAQRKSNMKRRLGLAK